MLTISKFGATTNGNYAIELSTPAATGGQHRAVVFMDKRREVIAAQKYGLWFEPEPVAIKPPKLATILKTLQATAAQNKGIHMRWNAHDVLHLLGVEHSFHMPVQDRLYLAREAALAALNGPNAGPDSVYDAMAAGDAFVAPGQGLKTFRRWLSTQK